MKKIISLFALAFLFVIHSSAGRLELTGGSIDCIKGQEYISVSLDYSNTMYNGKTPVPFSEYLKSQRRLPNWEYKSLEYFCEWFNDETEKTTVCIKCENVEYEIVVVVNEFNTNGRINATILIKKLSTDETMATFSLKGGDGDAKDMVPLRDPMKDAGECIGKFFNKNL